MVNDKPAATTHGSRLTQEEMLEELEEMGLEPQDLTQVYGVEEVYELTPESVTALGDAFEEMLFGIDAATGSFSDLVEMHQKLEPKHARSPKRYAQHKKAVERRRKRKNGGKK